VIRDLSDDSNCPIVFLSVSRLAARFARPTPFTESRLASRVEFTAPTLKDATQVAAELVEDVTYEPGLIAACLETAGGSLRSLLALYGELEEVAKSVGVTSVSLGKAQQLRAFAGLSRIAAGRVERVALSASENRRLEKTA
jgi:hypothetical protein